MKTVVIDAGHGGTDPGAVGPGGHYEKDVTLQVAAHAAAALRLLEVNVVLTREADVSVSLNRRVQHEKAVQADAFVSIHCNAATSKVAHGMEVFHYPTSTRGAELAHVIHQQLAELLVPKHTVDRGVKTARFYVLKRTASPAALVELMFISNPDEERLLIDAGLQVVCGEAIAVAVNGYLS